MHEKRQHPRIALDGDGWQAALRNQLDDSLLGQVVNLSLGGMLILSTRVLDIDALYQVELTVSAPDGTRDRFNAGVLVLWSSETQGPGTAWAGLQIIDIDDDDRARMKTLAERGPRAD